MVWPVYGFIPALIRAAATSGRNAAMALPALERCTGERRNASVVKRRAPSPSTRSMYNTSPPDGTPSCTVSPIAFRNSTSNGNA